MDTNSIVDRINDTGEKIPLPKDTDIHTPQYCYEEFEELSSVVLNIIQTKNSTVNQAVTPILNCLIGRIRITMNPEYSRKRQSIYNHIYPLKQLIGLINIITSDYEFVKANTHSLVFLENNPNISEVKQRDYALKNEYVYPSDFKSVFIIKFRESDPKNLNKTIINKYYSNDYYENINHTIKRYINRIQAYAEDVNQKLTSGDRSLNTDNKKKLYPKTYFPRIDENIVNLITNNKFYTPPVLEQNSNIGSTTSSILPEPVISPNTSVDQSNNSSSNTVSQPVISSNIDTASNSSSSYIRSVQQPLSQHTSPAKPPVTEVTSSTQPQINTNAQRMKSILGTQKKTGTNAMKTIQAKLQSNSGNTGGKRNTKKKSRVNRKTLRKRKVRRNMH